MSYFMYYFEIWGRFRCSYSNIEYYVRTITLSGILAPTHALFERLNILKFNNLVIRRYQMILQYLPLYLFYSTINAV